MRGPNRRVATRDRNESEIVSGLRRIPGVRVYLMDMPCDALVGFRGNVYLMEFKGRKAKLSPAQKLFDEDWPGYLHVVRTLREAVSVLGIGTDPPYKVDHTSGKAAS